MTDAPVLLRDCWGDELKRNLQRTKFQQQLENFKAEATKSAELFC